MAEWEATYEIRLRNKDKIHRVGLSVKREPEGFLSRLIKQKLDFCIAEDKENFIHQKIHMHDCKWEIRKVETHHHFFNGTVKKIRFSGGACTSTNWTAFDSFCIKRYHLGTNFYTLCFCFDYIFSIVLSKSQRITWWNQIHFWILFSI